MSNCACPPVGKIDISHVQIASCIYVHMLRPIHEIAHFVKEASSILDLVQYIHGNTCIIERNRYLVHFLLAHNTDIIQKKYENV